MPPLNTNVDQKRLRTTKFPPEFDRKVDSTKVNFNVMKLWINEQLVAHMGIEDDVVKHLLVDMIETPKYPDIKSIQIQLAGFLNDKAPLFCKELWNLLLDAQASDQGVPQKLIDAKKDEMQRQRAEKERARMAASRRQQELFETQGREADEARRREDKERYYRRQQMRGGQAPDTRPRRDASRSPSPRRRRRDSDDFRRPPPRQTDSYVPTSSNGPDRRRRSRSPLPNRRRDRSLSRTRSPEPRRRRDRSPPRQRRSRSPPPRRRARDDSRSRSPPPRSRAHREDRSSSPPVRKRQGRVDRSRSHSPHRRRRQSPRSSPRAKPDVDLFDDRKGSAQSQPGEISARTGRLSPVMHKESIAGKSDEIKQVRDTK